ncbi:hypothetical protein V5O48_014557, partial [Marasmius crinis-equi]
TFQSRSGDYYALIAKNKSQGNGEVPFFCQTEWFNEERLGKKNADGYYEVTIGDKYQYGQKNKDGDNRWVAFHDKGRKPYQHRFVKTLLVKGGELAGKIAGLVGFPQGSTIVNELEKYLGDYLHDF